jgi:plasmid replication initiation protein
MENKLLVQDNALTTARYEMTALEKNIMYAVMAQIEDNDLPTKCYKISLTDISKFTNRRVRNDDFKDAIQRLLTRDFFIKDSGGYLQSTFIASAYHDNRGFVDIEIGSKLRPFLFSLKKNFTTFGLAAATGLSSKYAKRLYEMLCQFKSTGLFRISVRDMKERFCLINDDGTEKLEQWISFENRVLKVAQAEINEKADFQFDYKLRMTGRKVTGVDFVFRKPVLIAPPPASVISTQPIAAPQTLVAELTPEQPKQNRMIERLTEFGLTPTQINSVLKKQTEQVINKALYKLTCDKDAVKNTAAYLLKVFEVS